MERKNQFYLKQMAIRNDQVHICGDHTFKVMKSIKGNKALYDMMNNMGEIIGFAFTPSTDMKVLKPYLQILSAQRNKMKQPPYQSMTSDLCCQIKALFNLIFPSLSKDCRELSLLPLLHPERIKVVQTDKTPDDADRFV